MKMTKRMISILISCLMLLGILSVGVFAEGTRDNPINANDKWFGYGVDCYLLNPTIAEGTTDGLWYELTIEQDGILYLEHKYKDVDYTITVSVDGLDYEGGSVDGVIYNGPIMTLPVQAGYVATIQIVTKDAAAGTVYANMNVITGDSDNPVKVKSAGIQVYVGAGETVYFQDDTLNADYATKGLLVEGSVSDTVFYTVSKNSESGALVKKAVTDTDDDGAIEAKLGGSLGSAGAPPVKPMWAIENNTTVALGTLYFLTIVDDAHECVYDDATDADCNTCGEIRDIPTTPEPEPEHKHQYDHAFDGLCNTCGEERDVELPLQITGNSVSKDVNGLAWIIDAKVDGMEMNECEAIYDNATVAGCKLIKMGAVVSNNSAELGYVPNLDDVDNIRVLNIEAKYLYEVNEDAGTVTYAIRVIDIPDEYKDREIDILTYIIFEDEAGVQHTLYCNSATGAYNWYA